jgi:uncharacterized membrane protein YfcA
VIASLPSFTTAQWLFAILGAFCIGFAKAGFSGAGLANVLIMAWLFGARKSTGVVLPMLICGDILSVIAYHQHARWATIRRMLPPAIIGIVAGWALMQWLNDAAYGPVIGWVVLVLAALQAWRRWRPTAFEHIPHSRPFAWTMGGAAGVTTMVANGAGPVMTLYFLAVGTPKFELVGTMAWFFLIVNCLKVPFSIDLGLIYGNSLLFNLVLIPAIACGIFAGRRLIKLVSQDLFEALLLVFAAIAALRMIRVF